MARKASPKDPRFNITKTKRSYKSSSGFRYAEEIGLFSSSIENVICPRCLSEKVRRYGKGNPVTRWDLLKKGKGVGLVTLQSQLWACRNCKHWKFLDPHFPYTGTKTTTPEFDQWVLQQLLRRPETFQTDFAARFDLPVSTIDRIVREELRRRENCVMCAVPVKKLWIAQFHYQKSDCLIAFGQDIADLDFCSRAGITPDSCVLLGISKGTSIQNLLDDAHVVLTESLEQIFCPDHLVAPTLTELCTVTPYAGHEEPELITRLLIEINKMHSKKISFDKFLLFLLYQEVARLEELHRNSYGYFASDCYTSYVCRCLTSRQANYSVNDLAHWADAGVHYYCIDLDKLLQFIESREDGT